MLMSELAQGEVVGPAHRTLRQHHSRSTDRVGPAAPTSTARLLPAATCASRAPAPPQQQGGGGGGRRNRWGAGGHREPQQQQPPPEGYRATRLLLPRGPPDRTRGLTLCMPTTCRSHGLPHPVSLARVPPATRPSSACPSRRPAPATAPLSPRRLSAPMAP